MKEEIHRLNCYVENKPGVLARIVGLISGRGYNIQTLNVGPTEDGTVSRMRIDVLGSERVVRQIILQLRNQVSVIEVTSRRWGAKSFLCKPMPRRPPAAAPRPGG